MERRLSSVGSKPMNVIGRHLQRKTTCEKNTINPSRTNTQRNKTLSTRVEAVPTQAAARSFLHLSTNSSFVVDSPHRLGDAKPTPIGAQTSQPKKKGEHAPTAAVGRAVCGAGVKARPARWNSELL
jgi:hypothetical protein